MEFLYPIERFILVIYAHHCLYYDTGFVYHFNLAISKLIRNYVCGLGSFHRHFRYDIMQFSYRKTSISSNCFHRSSRKGTGDHRWPTCAVFFINISFTIRDSTSFRKISSIHNYSIQVETLLNIQNSYNDNVTVINTNNLKKC